MATKLIVRVPNPANQNYSVLQFERSLFHVVLAITSAFLHIANFSEATADDSECSLVRTLKMIVDIDLSACRTTPLVGLLETKPGMPLQHWW